jgi:hypothetical protein
MVISNVFHSPMFRSASFFGVPPRGRIALQHHGSKKEGQWVAPPALVQFRRIAIKELGS